MALTIGTRLGPYAIAARIGVGGSDFVKDNQRLARSERERARLFVSSCRGKGGSK